MYRIESCGPPKQCNIYPIIYVSIIYLDWSLIMHQDLENYKDVLIFYLVLKKSQKKSVH